MHEEGPNSSHGPDGDAASEPWRKLWAKSDPRHPLWKHLLDAAAVSLALRNPFEGDNWSPALVAWLVGMHDVGKADATFQRMHEPSRAELEEAGFKLGSDDKVRHERVSALYLREYFLQGWKDERLASSVAMAVAAHHGHWCADARPSGEAFREAQTALGVMLAKVLKVGPDRPAAPADLSAFGVRLAGHIVLCDWIASNEAFFTDERLHGIEDPVRYLKAARKVAKEMVGKLQLAPDGGRSQPKKIVDQPRPLQAALLKARLSPGLVVIEAPMGEGKTEAAWILAERWRPEGYRGMYMGLPTMATGDAIFERYERDYLEKLGRTDTARLIHGMAWLRDEAEPDARFVVEEEGDEGWFAAQWMRPTRRAMLAPHGAGTVDQFLMAALNARFGFLRLYGLDRRVLVIDEVHAYDAYMTAVLCRGLQWCAALRIPVVLLSATLSAGQRAKLTEAYGAKDADPGPDAAYPLITHVGFDGGLSTLTPPATAKRTLALKPCSGLLGDAEETARLAERLAGADQYVCVIVNTVRQAQAVYEQLALPDEEKDLFHARFTAEHRKRIADRVIARFGKENAKREGRFVLVATQVVEQSLDVDFDEMITEIAPMDLLLQRSGRLHRHRERPEPPRLHILLSAMEDLRFGGTEKVYSRYILLRTLALVARERTVELPRDFRPLIEAVYGAEPIPTGIIPEEALSRAYKVWQDDLAEMESAASPFLIGAPARRLFRPIGNVPVGDDSDNGNGWRAKTRLGANDRTGVFVRSRDVERLRQGRLPLSAVRDLYRSSLRVPHYVPLNEPDEEFGTAVEAQGALRGLVLIPHGGDRRWRGGGYQMCYDEGMGLTVVKS